MGTEEELRTEEELAHHEAGHAVMACLLEHPFKHATIEPDEDGAGHVLYENRDDDFDPAFIYDDEDARIWQETLMTVIAGDIAEELLTGRKRDYITHEMDLLIDGALCVCGSGDATGAYVDELLDKVRKQLRDHWSAVERVASQLLEHKRLSYEQVNRVVNFILK